MHFDWLQLTQFTGQFCDLPFYPKIIATNYFSLNDMKRVQKARVQYRIAIWTHLMAKKSTTICEYK